MSFINLVGLAANDPVPGNYIEVDFAQGPAAGFQGTYAVLVLCNKSAAGTATPDTVVYGPDTPVTLGSEQDMVNLGGPGSEGHRIFRRFNAINKSTPLYFVFVTESGGAQSTGTITVATTATGAATLRIWIGDRFCDTAIATGDTPTVIATSAIKNINSMLAIEVLATNIAGVITITAVQHGLRSNFIRYVAQILPSSAGTTVTPTASTLMAGGTTADSNATALTTIAALRYYYIVSAAEDATQLGALMTQVNSQALPITAIRQSVYAGSVDTVANGIAIAQGLNAARCEIGWLAQSDMPPCEMAAHNAAGFALFEAPAVPRLNFNSFGADAVTQAAWQIKAPLSGAAPTRAQIASALNNGLSPIAVGRSGSTYLVKRATTKSFTGSAAVADYRIRPPHKRLICDRYADDLVTKQALNFSGKTIANDPIANAPLPSPNSVCPRDMTACINRLTSDYDENGLLQNAAVIRLNTFTVRETNPSTRLSSVIPLQTVDLLDQTAVQLLQVG